MPEILSIGADNIVFAGETGVEILGFDFGFTAGSVVISPTDNINDAGALTISSFTSWTDGAIILDLSSDQPSSTQVYWFVKDQVGLSNPSGFYVYIRSLTSVTWASLLTITRNLLGDAGIEFYTDTEIRRYLEYAEMFIALHRACVEDSGNLSLTAGVQLYTIHNTFTSFAYPVRVGISNLPLLRTTLATVQRLDKDWYTTQGTPEYYFMVGGTLMGFYPIPNGALTAAITFVRVPATATDPGPQIDTRWHRTLPLYASAVCYASEGLVSQAQENLMLFMKSVGLPRDNRFVLTPNQQPGATDADRRFTTISD